MITFTEYLEMQKDSFILSEGGNVVIKGKAAQAIDVEKLDRTAVATAIMKGLVILNAEFKKMYGLNIWFPHTLKAGKVFSGSAKHFFDVSIPTETFIKHKKTVGDIDLMVDETLKVKVRDFLNNPPTKDFGTLEFIGHKDAGDQNITLCHLKEFDINIQLDLEFVPFNGSEPSEWSKFSHSSSWDDMKQGLKGAFHKLLMSSLMGHKRADSILQMKTKQKEITASLHALSIKGLRKKFEKIGMQDDKPLIRETKSKNFITNFHDIFKEVFDIEVTEPDIELFWSFDGILKLMKKHMSEKQIKIILAAFVERLFGEGAQGLYRDEPNRDLEEKMIAVNYAQNKLGISYPATKLKKLQKQFYSNYK